MSNDDNEQSPDPTKDEEGILDQSELDALIARLTGAENAESDDESDDAAEHIDAASLSGLEPVEPESPPAETDAPDSGSVLDQDELDALIASQQGSSTHPLSDESSNDMLLSQDELDALIASSGQGNANEETAGLSRNELDAIVEASTSGAAPPSDEAANEALLDQSELDALYDAYEQPEPPTTDESPSDSSSVLDQDELDALIASQQGSSTQPSSDESGNEMLLSQDELDALIAGSEQGNAKEETAGLSRNELDAIVEASTSGAAPPSNEAANEALLDQSELDALYDAYEQSGGVTPTQGETVGDISIEPQSEPTAPEPLENANANRASDRGDMLSQEELDALLADEGLTDEASESLEEPVPPDISSSGESSTPEGLLDQSELDALIARTLNEMDEDSATDDHSDTSDDADLDDVGMESIPPGPEARPENWEPESAEQLTDAELDAALDGTDSETPLSPADPDTEIPPESEGPLDQSAIDSLLADTLSDPPQSSEPPPSEASEEPTEQVVPQPKAKSQPSDSEIDEILASLQAASASEEPEETNTQEPEPTPSATESPAIPDEPPQATNQEDPPIAEAEPPHRPPRKPLLPAGAMAGAAKWGVSIAAGLLVALLVYQGLTHLGERMPEIREAHATDVLPDAIATAEALVDAGQYQEAVRVLDNAIYEAPVGHPDLGDAEYLRVSARVTAMPDRIAPTDLENIQAAIGRVLAEHPTHERAPEAVGWQAKLYEAANMDLLAYNAYKQLLTGYAEIPNRDEALLEAARLALRLGRGFEAEDFARQLLRTEPTSSSADAARIVLGDALLAQDERDAAFDVFEEIVATQPDTRLGAIATARLGRIAAEEGQIEAAIELLENRLETATTIEGNDEIYLMLARMLRNAGRVDEAEQTLRELIDFFPDSPAVRHAHVELSRILDEQGQRQDALRLASHAARRYPDDPEVMRNLAHFLEMTQGWTGAAEALVAAEEAGAGEPAVLLNAARNFHRAGQYDRALEQYRRLEVEYPTSPEAFEGGIEMARVLFDRGQVRAALEQLADMAAFAEGRPQRLPVKTALGELYQELGFQGLASNVFEQVAVESTDPEVLAKAAVALFRNRALEQGNTVANRIDPNRLPDALAYEFLSEHGKALMRADTGRAIELMERAYEMYPDHRVGQYDQLLLEAYLATDQVARARYLVTELERHVRGHPAEMPRYIRAALTWADYLYDRGDYRAAADAYARAQTVTDPTDADGQWAVFQRAGALLHSGELEECLPLFEAIAESDSPWAEHARAKAQIAQTELAGRGYPLVSQLTAGEE